jgi:hypothetical protein
LLSPLIQKQAAGAVGAFIEYSKYNGYTIIVPAQFSSDDSNLLMKLQVQAIDAHAVSAVERDSIVNSAGWTTEHQPCVHINFCPVLRKDFNYTAFLPLSLVEKGGRVVAGVCVTSLGQCTKLVQRLKSLPYSVDKGLGLLLKRYVYAAYGPKLLLIDAGSVLDWRPTAFTLVVKFVPSICASRAPRY